MAAVKLENNGNKGIPDRIFIGRGGRCLFVEFKRPDGGGRVGKSQEVWLDFLGDTAAMVNDFGYFCVLFLSYFKGQKTKNNLEYMDKNS